MGQNLVAQMVGVYKLYMLTDMVLLWYVLLLKLQLDFPLNLCGFHLHFMYHCLGWC